MPELLSYVIILGMTMVFVLAMVYGFVSIKNSYQDSYTVSYSGMMCRDIESVFTDIANNNYTSGEMSLSLPDKIGDVGYRILFRDGMIQISDSGGNLLQSCDSRYNASGRISGGNNKIIFNRTGDFKIVVEGVQ
jgi:hypothetical protein